MKVCRHCHTGLASRPRGLCWGCYYLPNIRAMYPTAYGHCDAPGEQQPPSIDPAEPTRYMPGSAGKVDVLAARYHAGQRLWHPDDAREQTESWTGLDDEEFDDVA